MSGLDRLAEAFTRHHPPSQDMAVSSCLSLVVGFGLLVLGISVAGMALRRKPR